jgi:uncharacterized protein (TIGR03435 family)
MPVAHRTTICPGFAVVAGEWEERDVKVYRLTAPNGAATLKPSAVTSGGPDDDDPALAFAASRSAEVDSRGCPVLPPTRRASVGRNACGTYVEWSMPEFAQLTLGMAIKNETGGRNWAHVIDETGIAGRFDFNLSYDIGYYMMLNVSMPESMRSNLTSKNPGSIFKAVEALGLKVERAKLRVMVIQSVNRRPEEN